MRASSDASDCARETPLTDKQRNRLAILISPGHEARAARTFTPSDYRGAHRPAGAAGAISVNVDSHLARVYIKGAVNLISRRRFALRNGCGFARFNPLAFRGRIHDRHN